MTARDPLAVSCPKCEARPNEDCAEVEWPCEYYAMTLLVPPHEERVRAAEREKEEKK